MANFYNIIQPVLFNEGVRPDSLGWVNSSSDEGKETIAGVSRAFNPTWPGWAIVDSVDKSQKEFQHILALKEDLRKMIVELYREQYWLAFGIDKISSEYISYLTLDGVVIGGGYGVRWLQEGVNALDGDVEVDGGLGPVTAAAVGEFLPARRDKLAKAMLDAREAFHRKYAKEKKGQELNLAGWLNRVQTLRDAAGRFTS